MKFSLLPLAMALMLFACTPQRPPEKVFGYKGVYTDDVTKLHLTLKPPRSMESAGKIYVRDQLIFQVDNSKGIHVYNMENPSVLKPVGFIPVSGASELSISGNHLFVNLDETLLVVDISDLQHPKAVQMVAGHFWIGQSTISEPTIPVPEHNVYYECRNPGGGILIGWKKGKIDYYNACMNP